MRHKYLIRNVMLLLNTTMNSVVIGSEAPLNYKSFIDSYGDSLEHKPKTILSQLRFRQSLFNSFGQKNHNPLGHPLTLLQLQNKLFTRNMSSFECLENKIIPKILSQLLSPTPDPELTYDRLLSLKVSPAMAAIFRTDSFPCFVLGRSNLFLNIQKKCYTLRGYEIYLTENDSKDDQESVINGCLYNPHEQHYLEFTLVKPRSSNVYDIVCHNQEWNSIDNLINIMAARGVNDTTVGQSRKKCSSQAWKDISKHNKMPMHLWQIYLQQLDHDDEINNGYLYRELLYSFTLAISTDTDMFSIATN